MATTAVTTAERLAPAEASQAAITWRRFRKHRLGLIGMVTLIVLVLATIFVPIIMEATNGVTYETIDNQALIPVIVNENVTSTKPMFYSGEKGVHILGTNEVGRDIFTRLFFAGRI